MPKPTVAMSNEPAAPEPTLARHELIPLTKIAESPTNHRQRTWGDMAELTASIKAKGVLQPVLVRPMKGIGANLYELVFGHRRYRAAKSAGLEVIPSMIRELSDVDVLEAQVIENCQRENVHPLEEAEGYEQLLAQKDRSYTVDEIAAKVGKSKAYVYGRLKLTALCATARRAFYDGQLTASVALLVARIPSEDLQKKALDALEQDPWEKEPKSYREVAEIIRGDFMLRLAEAPFAKEDAALVTAAGACTACPHRSGAQPELFADLDKRDGDVCTNPPCFDEKKRAWVQRRVAEAEAAGHRVIAGDEAKKVVESYGSLKRSSGLVDLSDVCYDDPKNRTFGQLLGKKAPVVLVEKPSGGLVEAVDRKAALDILKEKGVKLTRETTSTSSGADDDYLKRERRKQALKRRTVELIIGQVVDRAEARELDEDVVRYVAEALLGHAWHDVAVDVVKRRGIERGKKRPEEALTAAVKDLTTAQLRGLIVELLVTKGAYFAYQSGQTDSLRWAAKLYKVDLEKAAADAKAELREKDAAKKGNARKATPPPKSGRETWPAGESRVPSWVADMTGLAKNGPIIERYGEGATFERGLPLPPPRTSPPSREPAQQIPKIDWRVESSSSRVGKVEGGSYVLSGRDGEWTGRWLPAVGTGKTLFMNGSEAVAADACLAHHVERCADAMLSNAGDGELTRADTKGEAVARKKGRR